MTHVSKSLLIHFNFLNLQSRCGTHDVSQTSDHGIHTDRG